MKSIALRSTIWDGKVISLPDELSDDYLVKLTHMSRLADAQSPKKGSVIGGVSEESTHDHFVHAFAASATRTSFLILDPREEFEDITQELMDTFTDGTISVLDMPCGSGGSILGFLGCLYQLRKDRLVSNLPVDIAITAGDISESALLLYNDMLTTAAVWLEGEGIRISWSCKKWDVTDPSSTAALVDTWFDQSKSEEWVVLIAAISGFLGSVKGDFEHNKRFYQHISERMHDRLGSITWVEPVSNDSEWIFKNINLLGVFGLWIIRTFMGGSRFRWFHPIKKADFSGGLRILESKNTSNI